MAAAISGTPAVAHANKAKPNICAQQVIADVKQRFNHDVSRVELYWDYGSSPESSIETGSAVAYVAQCEGYYWYEVFAARNTCDHLAHHGQVQDYISFRSINGACK